jgi:hypothetical protein
MRRFFQFPELLLLLMLPLAGMGFSFFSFMVIVSWGFHVLLRSKYPSNYPAFGSWVHVVLSILCWATMLLIIKQLAPVLEPGKIDPSAVIMGIFWGTAGGFVGLLLIGMQVFFWLIALYSLNKRAKQRR